MALKPYADGVPVYVSRNWSGIIPIRRESKAPAMSDVTGYSGRQLTPQESMELAQTRQHARRNLGLRLPPYLVGVDVDGYSDKVGAQTLANLERELGPLPRGAYSSARGPGVSGIRFFKVPSNLDYEHVFGPDIECIRFAHRFAVAWPSIHPKTETQYRWYDHNNELLELPPDPDTFPDLPEAWVERFGHEPRAKRERIGDFLGIDAFYAAHDSGDKTSYFDAVKRTFSTAGGSRHDSMLKALGWAMRHAVAGLYSARWAVEQLHELWNDATDGEDREAEFQALVERAAEDAATQEIDPYLRGLMNPAEAVTVADADSDNGDIILFERPSPEEATELSKYVSDAFEVKWTSDIKELYEVDCYEDRTVTVFLYENAGQDRETYDAAVEFQQELSAIGANVKFVSGIKDIYKVIEATAEDKRQRRMARSIETAEESPAKSKPRYNKKREAPAESKSKEGGGDDAIRENLGNRRMIEITEDPKIDNDNIISAIKAKWGGRKVFTFGGAISRVDKDQVELQSKPMWMNTIVEACMIVKRGKKGDLFSTKPPEYSVTSTLARTDDFPELLGVKHSPFVRADGTVYQEPGYDPVSKMKLFLSEDLSGIEIPESPGKQDVIEARELLDDWLYDFRNIMPSEADRANALALVLTPFIRGLVPIVPLCVVNGLQHGVGKNKFANGIAILYTGKDLIPKTFTSEDEEQRKALMSIFRDGDDFVCYDEAHYIDGKALAQALTAHTWSDRLLGQSRLAEYPNNATWMSLGNNVRIEGDCLRRVYQVQLKPRSPNPENRTSSDFKHPDFENWTKEIRKELLVAALTVILGWFTAGKPRASQEPSFGSYETWESIMRGILEYAEVDGFLENRDEIRGESSANLGFWVDHLSWLHHAMGNSSFTVKDVHRALTNDSESEYPPGLEDTSQRNYTRQLGINYSKMRDRYIGSFRLTRSEDRERQGFLWRIEKHDG